MSGQRGLALVVAMLLAAVCAALAGGLIARQELALRRAQASLAVAQAQARAPALVLTALRTLAPQAVLPATLEVDGANITVASAHGCLNINALLRPEDGEPDAAALARLERLLAVLEVDDRFVPALLDWLDADGRARVGGAEDDWYSRRRPPRRAANAPLADLSELVLLRHARRATLVALRGHACALPPDVGVDVNHADAAVWRALAEGLSPARARELAQLVRTQPFADVGALAGHPLLAGARLDPARLVVRTQVYALTIRDAAGPPGVQHLTVRTGAGGVQFIARRWAQE